MKGIIKTILTACCLLTSQAVSAVDPCYSFSFDAGAENPLEGWTCRGSGKTPKAGSQWSAYFPEGSEAYVVLSFPGVKDAAYSNSNTEEGGKVDEWLISPSIQVPEGKDRLILRFDEIAIGSIRPCDYDVYLSTGGVGEADFATLLHSGRPKGSTSAAVANKVCVPLNGCGGKDIRLAFVNRSGGTGLLGFTDIMLEDYDIEVTSLVPEFVSEQGGVSPRFEVSVMTPGDCAGFTARFKTPGEADREYSVSDDLSKGFSTTLVFSPDLELSFGEKKEYSVEFSFADPAFPAFVCRGSVTCAEGFPGVCVMEEATGSWCPACVRGIAAIERYTAEFPGQFFGIAVHETDPMTVNSYITPLKEESKISSFPSAWFNRRLRDDPLKINHVRDFVSRRLPTSVAIDRVDYHGEEGARKLTVSYSPQLCYDTRDADLRAVVVLTEDHCKGTIPGWSQKNAYSGCTPESVGGPDWWPYFERFSVSGSVIPEGEMEFDHVAWGIYNDYSGTDSDISSTWQANTPQQYSITFDVPFPAVPGLPGVQDINHTAVTVILIDGATGQVVGADRMQASEFVGTDGILEIEMPDYNVNRDGDSIRVEGIGEASVDIFNIAGHPLASGRLRNGACVIPVTASDTPLIVRVVSGTHTRILKLL